MTEEETVQEESLIENPIQESTSILKIIPPTMKKSKNINVDELGLLPKIHDRLLLIAPSNSGKSVVLRSMLHYYRKFYDYIVCMCPSSNNDEI